MALTPSTGWGYYKQIDIADTNDLSADYPMELWIMSGTGTDSINAMPTGSYIYLNRSSNNWPCDIRFGDGTDQETCNELMQWYRASGSLSSNILVKMPTDGSNTIYLYLQNATAEFFSSGNGVFPCYFDFHDSVSIWGDSWTSPQYFRNNNNQIEWWYERQSGKKFVRKFFALSSNSPLSSNLIAEFRTTLDNVTIPNAAGAAAGWGISQDALYPDTARTYRNRALMIDVSYDSDHGTTATASKLRHLLITPGERSVSNVFADGPSLTEGITKWIGVGLIDDANTMVLKWDYSAFILSSNYDATQISSATDFNYCYSLMRDNNNSNPYAEGWFDRMIVRKYYAWDTTPNWDSTGDWTVITVAAAPIPTGDLYSDSLIYGDEKYSDSSNYGNDVYIGSTSY